MSQQEALKDRNLQMTFSKTY